MPLGCFYVRTVPANFLCFLQFWILDDACCRPRLQAAMSYAHRDSSTHLRASTHSHTQTWRASNPHTCASFCHNVEQVLPPQPNVIFNSILSSLWEPCEEGGKDVGAYFPTANFSCSKRKVLCVQIIELALVSKNNIITIINCNYSQINYAHRLQISLFPLLTLSCYTSAPVFVSGPAHVTHSTPTTTSKSVTTLTTVTTWSVTRPDTIDTYNWRTL